MSIYFMNKKNAHTMQYYCPNPLELEFYDVNPPKLLGAIYVSIAF